jgi:NodT family efflux transporter outer membrane factor (OMF) lipoprotein
MREVRRPGGWRLGLRIAAPTLLFGLSACTTLGPEYRAPEVDWLEQWQTTFYGQVSDPTEGRLLDLRFWWQLFDDPALNTLIELARQENPSLRIAGLRILESRALLGIAGSNRYPQVQQLDGALAYVNTQQWGGPGSDQDLVSSQAGFTLGWELDFWGRFQRGIESADAAFFASIANQQDGQVLLSAQIADLYYAYRLTQERIAIAGENAGIQERSLEITRRLFRSGQAGELDLQQARTQYLATLATIPGLQLTLTQTRNAIAALLGRPPGDMPELAGGTGELPTIEPLKITGIPARLLQRRPDVRAALWQIAAQSAQIGIAEADFYPAISLAGSLGWSATSLSGSPNTGTLAIGPALRWNLFDHGRIANNVRVQDARLQQLIEQYRNTVLQAAREIDDAAVTVVKTREQQALLSETVSASRRALELAQSRYQEGYADFQRVLDAQRALFSQSDRELVAQGSHINAVIALYKSLGGGWLDPVGQVVPESVRAGMRERTDWGGLLDQPLPRGDAAPVESSEANEQP